MFKNKPNHSFEGREPFTQTLSAAPIVYLTEIMVQEIDHDIAYNYKRQRFMSKAGNMAIEGLIVLAFAFTGQGDTRAYEEYRKIRSNNS
ncbi:MAG TPA: hypothetical protein VMR76_02005 [Candidatus Saccharimonadia bacterium]|nr:hypothetical protein [Candidatus Saccharimonadia bacterium]